MSQADLATTVEAAVRILRSMILDKEQAEIAAMAEEDLVNLHLGLGFWIRSAFGLWKDDSKLLAATEERDPDDAALTIILALWRTLRREQVRLH